MANGWLAGLQGAWPYLTGLAVAAFTFLKWSEQRERQDRTDAVAAAETARQAAAAALSAQTEIENRAAALAAAANEAAIKSLERALDRSEKTLERATVALGRAEQDRTDLRRELQTERDARVALSARVDELQRLLEEERSAHQLALEAARQREDHLRGEMRQRDQIIASLKKPKGNGNDAQEL